MRSSDCTIFAKTKERRTSEETHLLGEPGPDTRGPRTPGTEKAELDTATGVLAPPLPGPVTTQLLQQSGVLQVPAHTVFYKI